MSSTLSENNIRTLLSEEAKKPSKDPTGACTITVYGLDDTCTAPLTEKSCAEVATKVKGVYTWVKDGKCPEK